MEEEQRRREAERAMAEAQLAEERQRMREERRREKEAARARRQALYAEEREQERQERQRRKDAVQEEFRRRFEEVSPMSSAAPSKRAVRHVWGGPAPTKHKL